MKKATLTLDDGSQFTGWSFGYEGELAGEQGNSVVGEVVFNTAMTGYPESLTDPSYAGQILTMTFPLAGNYGVPSTAVESNGLPTFMESDRIHVKALVVADYSTQFSHWNAQESLADWLKREKVPAITGIDTRRLTKLLREHGVMMGRISLDSVECRVDSGECRVESVECRVDSVEFATAPQDNSHLSTLTSQLSTLNSQLESSAAVANSTLSTLHSTLNTSDYGSVNWVEKVSCKEVITYKPDQAAVANSPLSTLHSPLKRVVLVDCGVKANIIRCLLNRGVEVVRVPWDYDFNQLEFDGLFLANGPGDPERCTKTVEHIRTFLQNKTVKPLMGICLGNQLLARAAGAKTYKLKYGHRSHNQPVRMVGTNKCFITSQNHGYAVDDKTLPADWEPLFVNMNDGSNEGIRHKTNPWFSAQFHPEACSGPTDTEWMFDEFVASLECRVDSVESFSSVECRVESGEFATAPQKSSQEKVNEATAPQGTSHLSILNSQLESSAAVANSTLYTLNSKLKKVLLLGSGALKIGQAGEFDYSGAQALKALKEEGVHSVLINPNIATVQTSKDVADTVYFQPVTPEFVERVIEKERPDGILLSFGGQTALNCGVELYQKGVFEKYGVKVLGTPVQSIIDTEDRDLFVRKLDEIGVKTIKSQACSTVEEVKKAANELGYPVILRAAYALGGLGSGFCDNDEELLAQAEEAFSFSPQVLVEKSLRGWKEIEYEVVRDRFDNCITVCNMENFDPLGIHTGESIVIAPSQTLSNAEYHKLRELAIKIIRHVGIVGECNVQYALDPNSEDYRVIEVNARLSRSSALASKATGYPLAFVAAKLSLGYGLFDLKNSVTKTTSAFFEPALDYVVCKIPRWDLSKFHGVSHQLGSSMKSVGEVMAIGRTFEEAIQKGLRMIGQGMHGFVENKELRVDDISYALQHATDSRIFVLSKAIQMGYTVEQIHSLTKIDRWFLEKLLHVVRLDQQLKQFAQLSELVSFMDNSELLEYLEAPEFVELLHQAKVYGFSDFQIGRALGLENEMNMEQAGLTVREWRKELGVVPTVSQIDTLAAEYPAQTNYLYLSYL